MKPLTIEELKALQSGDWVWIKSNGKGRYYQKCKDFFNSFVAYADISTKFHYSDYGKTWLAYKNKEQAEAKGEILELPSIRPIKNKIGELFEVVFIQCSGTVCSETYPDKEQAKARLAELKKE